MAAPPPPPDPTGKPVVYSPDTTKMVEVRQPDVVEYTMSITSPVNLATAANVELLLTVESKPAGVDDATAASFIHFLDPTTREVVEQLEFQTAAQTQFVTVRVSFPTGSPTGEFNYWITTPGWPAGSIDNGTRINAQVSPPVGLPPPTVTIANPTEGEVFPSIQGGPPASVPIRITANAPGSTKMLYLDGFLSGKDADGGVILTETELDLVRTGMDDPTATGEITVPVSAPGTYTIRAVATSTGGGASTSSTFVVRSVTPQPPVVTFTQVPNATYDYTVGAPALQIPFAFKGTSAMGGIRTLTATLNGVPVSVTTSGLGQLVATATGTLSLNTAGDYTLKVAASSDYGTDTEETTFRINVITTPTEQPVRGLVFFDVDGDGVMDSEDYGIPGVKVKLVNLWGQSTWSTTDADGEYVFYAAPGIYVVWVDLICGFRPTTLLAHPIIVWKSPVNVPRTGFALCFTEMRKMKADGKSHGFWKTNLSKAVSGKSKGAQIPAATLRAYTEEIGELALSPFDNITMAQALDTMESNSSQAKALLAKQLLASEYNYANGAFIDGNGTLTYAFIYFGEQVLKDADKCSRTYVNWVKDWYDAYNNSYGGKVDGPLP